MGVPALFRWLSQKYPKIISQVIEEKPGEVDGQEIPVSMVGPNPNGEEFDNLYLDMNGIVHPCSHPEDRPPPSTEEEMMLAIFKYTDRVVNMVRPRKLLLIAVDGVAPRAKMNQQRSRRFRSAQEAAQKDEDKEEFLRMLKSQNNGVVHEDATAMAQKKTWDSNAITPGTPFMVILAASLRYWCAYKVNTDPAWEKVKVIISDATVPGEGEHKIMEFIRSQRSSPEHDPNTRHVIYGLDADLIMLGLATHEPHFRVLREDVFFQESKARTCHICGQKGHIAEACKGEAQKKEGDFGEKDKALTDKPFIWLHVSVLREYLEVELHVPQAPFRFDLERALDDWVFMCFFVGNDFLPHLPSLDIRENGIDTLIAIWRDNIPSMGGYVTKDGHVHLERAQYILDGLAKQEDAIFRRRRQTEERRDANAKRRKLEEQNRNNSQNNTVPRGRRGSPDYNSPSTGTIGRAKDPSVAPADMPLFVPGKGILTKEERAVTHDMVVNRGAVHKANAANKSAAAALKSQLLGAHIDSSSADQTGSTAENGADGSGQKDESQSANVTTTPVSTSKKRKAELMEDGDTGTPGRDSPGVSNKVQADSDEPPPDNVRLWEEGYADRYYEQKFKTDPKDIAFRNKVARAYVEGLAWVLLYYFQGCPSWTWYYPYHYAPFAADFVELDKMNITFEKGIPFKPYEQLMGVLPAASNHAIPEVFRSLMSDEDSEIIDFYPTDFPIDLNGKKFAWQGVALLPFIDEKRLLDAMATRYPLLSADDVARNAMGKDVLIMSHRHPLYEEIATNFYSKRQGAPKYKLNPRISEGLAGKVEKNEDYIPQSSLIFPLEEGVMPNLDEDNSISVHYEMPHSAHIHKSMLLRGVKFNSPTLDRVDIEATRGRANSSGRSHGGAPLGGGRGNGRGRSGQISYSNDRPNPFAQHLNPGFAPPPNGFGRGAPPLGQFNGYPPPPPRAYFNGPPPPPQNGYYGGPPAAQGRYNGPPPPPQANYYNGPQPTPQNGYRAGGHPNGNYVLPGKPQAKLQAVCTALWEGQRLVAYISGNALVILSGPHSLIQTVYDDQLLTLEAVAIDEASGKIAICSSEEVHIYKPYGKKEGALKWSFQSSLKVPSHDNGTLTLSWGSEEELLIGSSSLRLYQTGEDDALIWIRNLPKPVKIASFSYDASLIASIGYHDRLIKIWRRQSFGSDDTRFDFTYLPHPTAVTGIHWRRPHDRQQILDHVLFSICADSKIRIWAATDLHGLQALQLWADIDMQEAIQPRQLETPYQSSKRYAFIIDGKDFTFATGRAVQAASSDGHEEHHALEHLLEVAKTNPEVCVVVDRHGNMSAWGLENVGCKARKITDKFNVAHVENVKLSFPRDVQAERDNVQFLTFCSRQTDSPFTLLVHHFDGRIIWYESKLEELFDPSPRQQRVQMKALWTGHDGSVKKIVRSGSGKALISRTNDNEGLVWRQGNDESGMALTRTSSLSCPEHIHRSCLLQEGDFIINLHHHSITLWDTRSPVARLTVSCAFHAEGKPLCLIPLPRSDIKSLSHYVATITSMMEAIVWKVNLPRGPQQCLDEDSNPVMELFCTSRLGIQDDLSFVLPVDPAGYLSAASDFLDTFARDLAISYSDSGVLRAWTARLEDDKGSVNWLVTSTTETGINNPSLASGSSIRKIAIVDSAKTGLTIWDPWSGQLEYDATYGSSDSIQDLDWSSTPDEQSILAVGFPYRVMILAQMRYDYLDAGPAWAPIREIHIKELTSHPIGDSTWLGSGNLVIGAGNQLFVYNKAVDTSDDKIMDLLIPVHQHQSLSIFDLVTYLNGPLPVFHPQFLAQCILAGKLVQVQQIIIGLYQALKFFVAGDDLDSFVAMKPCDFYSEQERFSFAAKKEMRSSYADFVVDDDPETVTEELAASLNENLAKLAIPQLSSHEQFYLADIIECVATVEKQRRSMDENAMRYLLFFRQHMIRKSRAPAAQVSITWREIVWAYHSGSQDILVDLVSRQFSGRMLWEHARESGMFMWMTDLTALRAQFEVIARNEYTKTDEKNPIDCSLYYLALKKKSVLVGLWRMAAWNREQSGTQKLLRNDFSEARWKTAALKNAYALLGKRRFRYAAAFFLLAGNLQDAINVCANQLHDLQLAIAVARVYDGDDSLVLRSLLEEKVLPQAAVEGNRWLATWAFWMLGQREMAVRVLISPVCNMINSPEAPNLHSKSYLSSDPALVVLYKQLRGKTLQGLKGASKVSPRAEWDFVIENARLYDRMGCDLLALDLVRNWEFLRRPKENITDGTHPPDPRNMLRRRSSLVVDDMPSPRSPTEQKMKPMGKPAPTVFEEPSTNSLLDSFGF